MKQERVTRPKATRPSRTTEQRDETPATDRREIRKDIRRVWWPDA